MPGAKTKCGVTVMVSSVHRQQPDKCGGNQKSYQRNVQVKVRAFRHSYVLRSGRHFQYRPSDGTWCSTGHIPNVWKTSNKRLIGFLDPDIGTRGVTIRSQDSPRNGRRKAAYQTTGSFLHYIYVQETWRIGICITGMALEWNLSSLLVIADHLDFIDNRRERKDATVTADDSPIVT